MTGALSKEGQRKVLTYFDMEEYHDNYMKDKQDASESLKYIMMIRAISQTAHKRVCLPYIEGHHRSVTLFHLLCSAKIDSRQGKITYDSLKDEVIERGLAQINNTSIDAVERKRQNVEIKKVAKNDDRSK